MSVFQIPSYILASLKDIIYFECYYKLLLFFSLVDLLISLSVRSSIVVAT